MFLNDPESVPLEDRELEAQHFNKVVNAFKQYRLHTLATNAKRRRDLASIPLEDQELVKSFMEEKIRAVEERATKNADVIRLIVEGHTEEEVNGDSSKEKATEQRVTEGDMDKVRSTIRQFVRDWSEEGQAERVQSYGPILAELDHRFAQIPVEERGELRVLVPGAGLGRLAYDIVKRGFSCQGNEFSFYMLLASHFILNRAKHPEQYEIFPWIHNFSNHATSTAQLAAVRVPDVAPGDVPATADFSMVAGDFVEVYGTEEHIDAWDVVVTCFFMDTAKNVVEYTRIIRNMLKPNGIWINLGPLLYHWEGMQNEISIELTLEEVKRIIRHEGFRLENERTVQTTYASNPASMLKYVYDCAYFVAIKC